MPLAEWMESHGRQAKVEVWACHKVDVKSAEFPESIQFTKAGLKLGRTVQRAREASNLETAIALAMEVAKLGDGEGMDLELVAFRALEGSPAVQVIVAFSYFNRN